MLLEFTKVIFLNVLNAVNCFIIEQVVNRINACTHHSQKIHRLLLFDLLAAGIDNV